MPPLPQMPPQQPRPRKSHGCLYAFLGGVGAVVLLIIVIVAIAVGSSGGSGDAGNAGAPDDGAQPTKSGTSANVGDPVKDGKFTFTVLSTSTRTRVGDQYMGKTAQGKFLVVKIKVKNHGDEPQGLTDTAQELYGPGGKKYEADSEAAIYANGQNQVLYNDINPGNTVKGLLLFDVPKEFTPTKIVLHDSAFSGGVTVDLRGA